MGLGIKTKVKRRLAGAPADPENVEAAALAALARAPRGALRPAPGGGGAGDGGARGPLSVAFVVPHFVRGSGGHTTIANLIRGLEARGHACAVRIEDPAGRAGRGGPAAAAKRFREWFGTFNAEVRYGWSEPFAGADVVLATGWQTVARTLTLPAAGRAYLVQDHEPEFYPTSAQRSWAAASYRHGLHPITAGGWLAEVMDESYGMSATPFDLGIDGARYRPDPSVARRGDVVVAYARASTPRRGVPVALAALGELHRRRGDGVELWLFGNGGPPAVDFPYKNLGVVPEADLPAVYAEATAGLVLSLTNHSLVAQEMLACGLPCVELDAPSVVQAFGRDGPVDLAPLDPLAIADALERLLDDPALRSARARGGETLRAERTWERAAAQVEAGLWAAIDRTQEGAA